MGIWLAVRAVRASVDRRRLFLRLAVFGAAIGVSGSMIAALNDLLYSSPLRFGYGNVVDIFSIRNVWPNLIQYGRWFVETQTWIALLALPALGMALPRRWFPAAVRPPVVLGLMVAVLTAEYCAYEVFDHWSYLRFFLPVWPALMVGIAIVLLSFAGAGRAATGFAVLVLTIALGCQGFRVGKERHAFDWERVERKFPAIGLALRRLTPPNAVVFSMQHTGAIRYYSGRTTIAYPSLDPLWLDRAVQWLAANGAHSYAVLESWEVTEFRGRFAAANSVGRLAMTPIAAYKDPDIYVYDLLKPMGARDGVEIITDRDVPSCPEPAAPSMLVLK